MKIKSHHESQYNRLSQKLNFSNTEFKPRTIIKNPGTLFRQTEQVARIQICG